MKIVILTLAPKGGMVHYGIQLANALVNKAEVTYITSDTIDVNQINSKIDVKLLKLPVKKSYSGIFNFLKIIKIIKETNPDIIHFTVGHPWIVCINPFIRQYLTFMTFHDPIVHKGEKNIFNMLNNWIHKKSVKYLFVHGSKLRNQLIKQGYDESFIFTIKHGDYSFFTKYGKNVEKECAILFFGRILDYKGLEYLLQAVPKIKTEIEDIKIIIAGNGPMAKYEKYFSEDIDYEIINKYIPDENVASYFQRASVVVLPYTEGTQTGIIPIAYAFKKPVVVTNVGSIPEVVEDGVTGFIVPPKDSDALADAIVKILKDDDLRRRMGENAYRKMKDELSWEKIAEKTIEIYKEAINLT